MGLADAETLTLPARPRESRRVSSFATTPCPNNPRLIPAPLSMSPHNTHYGQEGRVRVEWGGVPDGPSTRRKGRCRILLPAAKTGAGLVCWDRGQARDRRSTALEPPPAAALGRRCSQALDDAMQPVALGFGRGQLAAQFRRLDLG